MLELGVIVESVEHKGQFAMVDKTKRSYFEWESDIFDLLCDQMGIDLSDAQGFVDCHNFEMKQEWSKGSCAQVAVDRLKELK